MYALLSPLEWTRNETKGELLWFVQEGYLTPLNTKHLWPVIYYYCYYFLIRAVICPFYLFFFFSMNVQNCFQIHIISSVQGSE